MTIERTVDLPYGTRLTFRFGPGFEVEWHSGPPRIRAIRERADFMLAYRAARMSFAEEVAATTGKRIGFIDLDTGEIECPAPRTRH